MVLALSFVLFGFVLGVFFYFGRRNEEKFMIIDSRRVNGIHFCLYIVVQYMKQEQELKEVTVVKQSFGFN